MMGPSKSVKAEKNLEDSNFKKEDEFKLQDDLSFGQEKYKIPVYNYFNFEKLDKEFKYSTICRRRPEHTDKEECCNCKPGECNTPKCSCWANSTIRLQDRKIKNLKEVILDPMKWMLVECRDDCGCQRKCDNWLTQEQIQLRIEIDYFKGKGFGVRIKDFVAKGEYFGEYVGEIIEDDEREDVSYQFAIEEGPGRKHKSFIDARLYGNATRFLNHSCHSCLSPFLFVRGKENSRLYPQLGFVFTRSIAAGNEITIDYNRGYWENADYDCNCGTFACLKPSSETRYRTKASSNRIRNCQTLEENINLQVVKEAKLCEQRLALLREGKTLQEVKKLLPSQSYAKKPAKITPYTIFDRCSSPLKPPEIECLDTDSETES